MTAGITDDELLGYLDEQLPVERASLIEQTLRNSPELRQSLAELIQRRDQGGHTVGEIWRRFRLTCPTKETLGSFILEALDDDLADYIRFHLETVGCRLCGSVYEELLESHAYSRTSNSEPRRQRYFESSAGLLRGSK
jgi:hypothetical protein